MKTLVTAPSEWNSVHRPIPFVYDYDKAPAYTKVTGGFVEANVGNVFDFDPVAGQKIYIETGTFSGVHVVSSFSSGIITTTTASTSTDIVGAFVRNIRLPEIKLYSGYAALEEYATELPFTLVATFTPENSPDNDVQFDVSEYLKSIFRIVAPVEGKDFNMFNRFRLFFDGILHESYMVLNSSIKTELLMSDYANTGNPLNSFQPPIVFGCGKTIISYLEGNVITNVISDDDDITFPQPDYSGDDYDSDDYYTN